MVLTAAPSISRLVAADDEFTIIDGLLAQYLLPIGIKDRLILS